MKNKKNNMKSNYFFKKFGIYLKKLYICTEF